MINRKSFIYLFVVTAIVVIAAFWVSSKPEVQDQSGQKLFPNLLKNINDISEIVGTTSEGTFTVLRQDTRWVIKEKSNYQADRSEVHNFLIGAANLKRLQPKTSNPELYKKLGLQDVTVKEAKSVRYVLKNDSTVVADGLFGKQRPAKADRTRNEFYVRLQGDPQSWLVEGKLKISKSADDWLDNTVLEVNRSRIRQVVVTHPGAEKVVVRREKRTDRDYKLMDVPTGAKIDLQFGVNDVATSFASITMDSVEPGSTVDIDDGGGIKAVMETFDGLHVVMRTAKKDGIIYANYEASFEPAIVVDVEQAKESKETDAEGPKPVIKTAEEVKTEVATLNQRWKDWVYRIPEFKLKNIIKPKADLYSIKKEEGTESK